MTIEELLKMEKRYIDDIGFFEENYKHRGEPCSDYKKFGYCSHVESAIKRNKEFGERFTSLFGARLWRCTRHAVMELGRTI